MKWTFNKHTLSRHCFCKCPLRSMAYTINRCFAYTIEGDMIIYYELYKGSLYDGILIGEFKLIKTAKQVAKIIEENREFK